MKELTPAELARFDQLRAEVKATKEQMIRGAKALCEIHERKWYKSINKCWDKFCELEFGIHRRQAYNWVNAAKVIANLESVQRAAHFSEDPVLPKSVRTACALADLPKEDQPAVWQQAVEDAQGDPTEADVEEAIAKALGGLSQEARDRVLGKQQRFVPSEDENVRERRIKRYIKAMTTAQRAARGIEDGELLLEIANSGLEEAKSLL